MRYSIIILTLISVYSSSCKKDEQYADESLNIDEYYDIGIHSIDQKWSNEDYFIAADILTRLKDQNKLQIPRKNSKKSRRLFEKLTDNEAVITMTSITENNSKYFRALNALYIVDGDDFQPYNDECIEVMTFGLKNGIKLYESLRTTYDTLSNIYAKNKIKPHIVDLRDELTANLISYLDNLSDEAFFESNRILAARYFSEMIPATLEYLSDDNIEVLVEAINFHINLSTNSEIENILIKLVAYMS